MTLRTSFHGISAIAASFALSGAAAAQTLDYASLSGLFGEPVTAGATGAPQRASDVPATMIIITQDQIQRFPEYDLPGILRHYGGMDVTRYAFGDGQVNIRGAAGGYTPRMLVLVNGREVYIDTYGYTAWSSLPVQLDEIQQIEVVKGPQSALYGFNAVGGVVNIITRNPANEDYLVARANYGGDEYSHASIVGGRSFGDRISLRFSYGETDAEEFTPVQANAFANTLSGEDFTRDTGAVQARIQLSDTVSLSAEATFTDGIWAENTSVYYATRALYELNSYKLDLEADTDFGFVTVSGYINETDVGPDFGPLSAELTVLRAQNLFKIGTENTVRLSVEYREGEAGSFPQPGNGDFGYETTAFAAMWNRRVSRSLDFTLAGRLDRMEWSRDGDPNPAFFPFSAADHAVTYEEFSYNAALVWRPEFGGTARFTAGRGIQAPTMFDIGFTLPVHLGGGVYVALSGNPSIEPSVITNYEIAYDRSFANGLDFRGAVFIQNTEDVKGAFGMLPDLFPPAAPGMVYLFDNRGDTETYGAEFTLAGTVGTGFDWDINYTYKQVEDDLSTFALYTPLDFEGATPEHILNGHVGWSYGRFTTDVYANYVSSIDMPIQPEFGPIFSQPIDDTIALSARAAYDFSDHLAIAINAQNVNYGGGEETNTHHQNESRIWLALTASY